MNNKTEKKLNISNLKAQLLDFLATKKALPIIVLVGIAVLIVIVKLNSNSSHDEILRPSMPVKYVAIKQVDIQPEIIGFGVVEPDATFNSKAEVTGSVSYIHPKLRKGEIFQKGTLLIKIDDKDYLLQLKQAEADLLANRANLKEMELNIENNELELILAGEKLKVRNKEFMRLKELRKTGAVSQSNLDAERQNLLQQKQEVQQLENKKTTLPSTLEVMKAQLAISKANLQKSQRDLDRTEIRIPFDGRISSVYTEQDQFMLKGSSLFDASGLHKIIINAQFPIDHFSAFVSSLRVNHERNNEISSLNSGPDVQFQTKQKDNAVRNMASVIASLGLSAMIEDASGEFQRWEAKVERFSDDLDPKSRTVGVIIAVEGSYERVTPGLKPPLLEGMYMKIFLRGLETNSLVIPKFAVHEGSVYKINKDNKLEKIRLDNRQYQGRLVLLNPESAKKLNLNDGDRIITSDLFPAVNGMRLTPIMDEAVTKKLAAWMGNEE